MSDYKVKVTDAGELQNIGRQPEHDYIITSRHGHGTFKGLSDALLALQMLASYENIAVNRTDAEKALNERGTWQNEQACLMIQKQVRSIFL